MNQPIAKMTYSDLYVKDLQESIKWYYKAFGFQIVSINPEFATLEYAPGRCVFLSVNVESPRKETFLSKNISAIRRQLLEANIELQVDEENHLQVIDLNGNTIDVWNNKYDIHSYYFSMPDHFVKQLIRCTLETRGEMHIIAKAIKDEIEYSAATDELKDWCQKNSISVSGDSFISSKYTGQEPSEPHVPSDLSGQVDVFYACLPISNNPNMELPEDLEYIYIPAQDYSVFPIDYSFIYMLRENELRRRSQFMNAFLNRPEGTFYILEYYKEDNIYAYIPYEWSEGKEDHTTPLSTVHEVGEQPRQYIDIYCSTVYSNDVEASAKWYVNVLGCEIKEITSNKAIMQFSSGVIFIISTDSDSLRSLSLVGDHPEALREKLGELGIEIMNEDDNNWFEFKGPGETKVDIWRGGFGMEWLSVHKS